MSPQKIETGPPGLDNADADRLSDSVQEPDSEEPPSSGFPEYVPGNALKSSSMASSKSVDDAFGGVSQRATASWPSAAVGPPGGATASWGSSADGRKQGGGAVNSFDSSGGYVNNSFDSTVTEYDYLTATGAQAELSPEYLEAVRAAARGEDMPVGAPWSGMQAMPAFGLPTDPASQTRSSKGAKDNSSAGLQSQAAEYEFMAAQLMAQAYQAKAAALRNAANGVPMPAGAGAAAGMPSMPGMPGMPGMNPMMGMPGMNPMMGMPGMNPMMGMMGMPGAPWGGMSQTSQSTGSQAQGRTAVKKGATKSSGTDESARTTVMLRNLPNDYTRTMLLDLMDEQGFASCFDFIYLPMDFKRKAGLGYAFVNMVTPAEAERVFSSLHGFSAWKLFSSSKVLEVAWGDPLQGLEPHVNRYRNSPVMHEDVPDEFRPMLFKDGVRIDFPPPTRKLRVPRLDFRGKNGGDEAGEDGME